MRRFSSLLFFFCAAAALAQADPKLFQEMRWRSIGPFRGGRTVAATGVPGQPNVFYIGVNNGGVWKSIDYGRVWTPIFDDQPTGSIGAIAVAPSDPNIIYAGSGEGLQRPDLSTGDGIYRSADAGKTWQHLGLRDGQQIPAIAVDPRDPNRLFVAVLGHPYGPNPERGIFRSTDGGKTFDRVLYKNENVGAMDVVFDLIDPRTMYAVLWESRQGPWENAAFRGTGSGLFKSTDGGTTWRQITAGLPSGEDLGRIGLGTVPADPKRMYAVVESKNHGGVYRSDDSGETWRRTNESSTLAGYSGDMNEIKSDPKNPDVIYVAAVASWKSTDGGKTFSLFRAAPGGDDYHRFWINPDNPNVILLAADQGAVITVNGGRTWSSWYNQPTAQFYHVITDNAFPYRVCGGQQESGSACVDSRGDDGQITFREWHPVGAEEYGYIAPDPLDPDIVYGGKVSKYDRRTDQVMEVGPMPLRGKSYRTLRTMPLLFSPVDPHTLFFASNTVWKTTNGAKSWEEISPDLTRPAWTLPANVSAYASMPAAKVTQRGVVYALAPSALDVNLLWAGTDDGLIHVTADGGKTWSNVTPSQLVPWSKVSMLEASHFDRNVAYAAINTFRLDDLRAHIYRTRDGGKTWTHITNGIPDIGIINTVREDPKRKGLLFAGSERQVYVSFDDGDHWQSLRLNMPASSVRDLTIHEDDLVAGTHGRGFWILDDLEPLRQYAATVAGTRLLKPADAWRWRWNKNTDTPLPPDEPAGENPPDGAIIDYVLAAGAKSPVTLEIVDGDGKLVRRYTSSDPSLPPADSGNVPAYWIRPPQLLGATAGPHRFVWDLHYTPAPGVVASYPISAVYRNTAPVPTSPWVMPGQYTVRLTVDGATTSQPIIVKMDPRVTTSRAGLAEQFRLSKQLYDGVVAINGVLEELHALRPTLSTDLGAKASELEGEASEGFEYSFPRPIGAEKETLNGLTHSLLSLMNILQSADVTPPDHLAAAAADRMRALDEVLGRWREFRGMVPAP